MTIPTEEIIAVIDNVIRIKRNTLGPALLSMIRNSLTRENPAYHQMKSLKERNPQRMMYMKLPPATISSFEEDDQTVYVPRGFKAELINLANQENKTIIFHDKTRVFERNPGIALNPSVVLRDYQRKGVGKMIMKQEGVLVAPCGGGKTVTGIAILATLKQPTLILVHTGDLMAQWQRELADKALLPGEVGQWGAGKKNLAQVTVGTIQTIIRMPPKEVRALLDNFGCVILDEAHHCPADTFMSVMNLCASKYRFGLTATPRRKDGLEFLMGDTIGQIQAEIEDKDLQAEGRSQSCDVRFIPTNFYSAYMADEWTKLIKEICDDKDRNRLIIDTIYKTWQDGHFPLVLSDRVEHCREIVNSLRMRGMNAHMLVGEVPKNIRERIIEDAKKNLIDAIVATKVADEGLDIPQLSCVHLVTPTSNEAKTQQRVGRIRRPMQDKKSLIIDYVDHRISSCLRMAKMRTTLYRRWGFSKEDGAAL